MVENTFMNERNLMNKRIRIFGFAAAEIRFRAERRLGEMLAAQKVLLKEQGGGMNQGTRGQFIGGSKIEPPRDPTPTLAELGIDKKLSPRFQKRNISFSWRVYKRVSAGEKPRGMVGYRPGGINSAFAAA